MLAVYLRLTLSICAVPAPEWQIGYDSSPQKINRKTWRTLIRRSLEFWKAA
jgi:hypothetical protein